MMDPLAPNSEDENGDFFDPWEALGMSCCSYNSAIDQQAIDVLRCIREKLYCSDIAARIGLTPEHVELFQSMFSSANWCEYGTSPRGCWFVYDYGDNFGDRLIAAWEAYFERHWNESPA